MHVKSTHPVVAPHVHTRHPTAGPPKRSPHQHAAAASRSHFMFEMRNEGPHSPSLLSSAPNVPRPVLYFSPQSQRHGSSLSSQCSPPSPRLRTPFFNFYFFIHPARIPFEAHLLSPSFPLTFFFFFLILTTIPLALYTHSETSWYTHKRTSTADSRSLAPLSDFWTLVFACGFASGSRSLTFSEWSAWL